MLPLFALYLLCRFFNRQNCGASVYATRNCLNLPLQTISRFLSGFPLSFLQQIALFPKFGFLPKAAWYIAVFCSCCFIFSSPGQYSFSVTGNLHLSFACRGTCWCEYKSIPQTIEQFPVHRFHISSFPYGHSVLWTMAYQLLHCWSGQVRICRWRIL